MVKTPHPPRSGCPINFGLEIFGDKWSLLILRDILIEGKRSFGEFQDSEEKISSNILAERLARLEQSGLISRKVAAGDGRQYHYSPTEAGSKLLPVLIEMAYWGATHDPQTAAPHSFVQGYEQDRTALINAIANGFRPSKA